MKISEIIQQLTDVVEHPQHFAARIDAVCKLSIQLAVHVQQLELDMQRLKLQSAVVLDDATIRDEVIDAASNYVATTGNSDEPEGVSSPAYDRLKAAVLLYNTRKSRRT